MLTREGCHDRQRRLWESLPEAIEWLLISDPRHVQYFSNFWVNPFSFSLGERGWLLLERDGQSTLFADNFAVRSAATEYFVDNERVEKWYDHQHSVINRDHALAEALKSEVNRILWRKGLVEIEWISGLALSSLNFLECVRGPDLGSVIRRQRRKKDADEIALLKQCMAATDAGHARARESFAQA